MKCKQQLCTFFFITFFCFPFLDSFRNTRHKEVICYWRKTELRKKDSRKNCNNKQIMCLNIQIQNEYCIKEDNDSTHYIRKVAGVKNLMFKRYIFFVLFHYFPSFANVAETASAIASTAACAFTSFSIPSSSSG